MGALKGLSQLALSKQEIGHDEVRQVRMRARPDVAVLGGLLFKLRDMLCVLCALQGRAFLKAGLEMDDAKLPTG